MQLNEMATELEDQRELATSRLTELEKLQQDHQEAIKQIETLKMDVREIYIVTFVSTKKITNSCCLSAFGKVHFTV